MAPSLPRPADFEAAAALEEISDSDIHFSRLSGMSPADIEALRIFSLHERLLIIIRCPKRPARYFHGKYPAKRLVTKNKSDPETGLAVNKQGDYEVSDYDLMSVFRFVDSGAYEKIFISGNNPNNPKSPLTREASALLRKANQSLQSRFQHGCQDDFHSQKNPGVKTRNSGQRSDHFAAFNLGDTKYLPTPDEAQKYYARYGLTWPYDENGKLVL
jgi:hypothetical protein